MVAGDCQYGDCYGNVFDPLLVVLGDCWSAMCLRVSRGPGPKRLRSFYVTSKQQLGTIDRGVRSLREVY